MPGEAQAAPAAQGTTLGRQALLPLPTLQPRLHLLCQDPQHRLWMLDGTLRLAQGLRQLIKALPCGKEAGRIADKQVASASSGCALLLICSDLESNTQEPQQALGTPARSWRNSPSPRRELKGKGSPLKAASDQPGESSRKIRHKYVLSWVTLLAQRMSSRQHM